MTRSPLLLLTMSSILFPTWAFLSQTSSSFILEWTLMTMNTPISFSVILDQIGTLTSATVMFIASMVMVFANSYMKEDPFKPRFDMLVILFILSMNLLVFIPHLMCLLIGWDGLGILSFILVIYYQTPKALGSGMLTALTNRIGDVLILIAIGLSLTQGHWNVLTFSPWLKNQELIAAMIVVAAMTKSAQMPFSSWLPAAMAAPTPVSALVHSSTLVTAGVFLLIRFHPFLAQFPWLNKSLLIISSVTMLMAGTSAMFECDLKKIIALSTLSQLSIMMCALALNQPSLALFHLITHAMFKALLFICAGSLIHLHHHAQDIRLMGNVSTQMPITMTTMLIANLSLCGFPFLSGFFSKHLILESLIFNTQNPIIITMFTAGIASTVFYSLRLTLSSLISPSSSNPMTLASNQDLNLALAPLGLCFMSVSVGAILNWMLITPSSPIFLLSPTLKMLTPTILLISTWLATQFMTSEQHRSMTHKPYPMPIPMYSYAMFNMWFLAPLTTQPFSATLKYPNYLLCQLDQGWLELPSQGTNFLLSKTSGLLISFSKVTFNQFFIAAIFLASAVMMYLP